MWQDIIEGLLGKSFIYSFIYVSSSVCLSFIAFDVVPNMVVDDNASKLFN